MGFERNPSFRDHGKAREPEDPLAQTYTDLLAYIVEESKAGPPTTEMLNAVVAWMGMARFRLTALHKAKVAELFPLVVERLTVLKWLVVSQWAVIGFLALLIARK